MVKYGMLLMIAISLWSLLFYVKKSQAAPVVSELAPDNAILADGRRFFAIGIYYVPKSEEPFRELADAGFNLVKCGSKEELDKADEYGLKAWVHLGDALDFSKDTEKRKQGVKNRIEELKDHPALLLWESMDEPAWTWKKPWQARASAEGLAQGHKFVKDMDPDHLLWINHAPRNTWKTLAEFSQNADVIACDVYPVISKDIDADKTYAIMPNGKQTDLANQTISCVGEYMDKLKKAAGDGRGIFLVAQGFAWDNEQNPDNPLYPTYEETRFMAYNAIIHGAKGILYWGTYSMPQPSEHWDNLKKVARELGDLHDVLASPTIPHNVSIDYQEMGFSIDSGVEVLVKEHQGTTYMLAANTTVGPAKVTFSDLPSPTDSLNVLFEDRSIDISSKAFKDSFEPYAVHVYRFK
jgi:hypothetical protein